MSMRSLFIGLLAASMLLLFTQTAPAAGPPEVPETGMLCKVYQVADLVIPIAGTFAARTEDGKPAANRTHEDRLIQLICSTLSPQSWSSQGGPGAIDYYPLTMALVVRHTPEMQDQVAELLAALRRLQDVEVSVELRFVTVSDECRTKLGIEDSDGGKTSIARLDDAQVRMLLETAQNDSRTNVMQAPKLTVFNGQKAMLDLTEKQVFVTGAEMVSTGERKMPHLHTKNVSTGLQASVLPVVAPDNRTVTLQLGVKLTRADVPRLSASPIVAAKAQEEKPGSAVTMIAPLEPCFSTRSFETTLKLTDGSTALICGWTRHSEVRNQTCPPVLSKIPYIGQLFRTLSYGKEREHLMVLVTPRVIVVGEKEEHVPLPEAKPTISTELLPMPRPIDSDCCVPAQYKEESADEMQSANALCAKPPVAIPGWIVFRGRLRLADRQVEGMKTYVIDMEDQGYIRPVAYAVAGPGIDLASQVGKVVEVRGPAAYRGDIRSNYMTVMQVSPEHVEE
jgi:type II secretory pathway component GspD/PulD (secretin)